MSSNQLPHEGTAEAQGASSSNEPPVASLLSLADAPGRIPLANIYSRDDLRKMILETIEPLLDEVYRPAMANASSATVPPADTDIGDRTITLCAFSSMDEHTGDVTEKVLKAPIIRWELVLGKSGDAGASGHRKCYRLVCDKGLFSIRVKNRKLDINQRNIKQSAICKVNYRIGTALIEEKWIEDAWEAIKVDNDYNFRNQGQSWCIQILSAIHNRHTNAPNSIAVPDLDAAVKEVEKQGAKVTRNKDLTTATLKYGLTAGIGILGAVLKNIVQCPT